MPRGLLLVALLLAPVAAAGNADTYDTFLDATGWNTQKKMTISPAGALHVAYVVGEDGGTEVLVARLEGDALVTIAEPRAAQGNASRPSLAFSATGELWVAWTERAEDDREVFAARVVDGVIVEPRQLSGGLGYAGFPSLAAGPEGRIHVAWYGFDGTFYQTFYREWDGAAWLPARQLSSGNLDANNPSVVVDEEGGVHVAWYKSDGRRYRIWYAERPAGQDWSLPIGISSGDGEAFNGALALDGAGRVHAAWDERAEDGYRILHAMRREDGRWSPPAEVVRGPDAGEYPAIARHGDDITIVWATADGRLLFAQAEGERVGDPQRALGNATGRLPSLRGPVPFGGRDADAGLDVLWTQVEDGAATVRLARLPAGCPLASEPAACPEPAPSRATPGAPAIVALLLAASSMRRRSQPACPDAVHRCSFP